MNYFVFSPVNCGIKINGTYICEIYTEPVKLNINKGDLIEFFSCKDAFLPLSFILGNSVKSVAVLENDNGNFIFPLSFHKYPYPYEKIYSEKVFSDFALNVYNDCTGKLLVENSTCAKIIPLPFYACVPQVIFAENRHIGLFFKENGYFYIINSENLENKLVKKTDEAYYENGELILKSFLPTLLAHEITERFRHPFQEGVINFKRGKPTNALPQELKTFAFLECLRIGDDVSDFLVDDFKGKEKLKNYLGNYTFIQPCPAENFEYALIYEREVKFIKFKTINAKICDLILND